MATVKEERQQEKTHRSNASTSPHPMNKPSSSAAAAPPPPTAAAVSAGSSTDDHAEVSSCFVSSPSSSTSSSAFLGSSSRFASGNVRIHQQQKHHQSQSTQQHPPLHSVLQEPRPGGLFPHLSHLGSDDDSLRVSSSTLFHDGATTAAESNVSAAPDSPGTAENHEYPHNHQDHSMEGATRVDQHIHESMAGTTTATTSRTQAEPMHNDVYECLCSPAAGSEDSDTNNGFFAPRHFKRRIADTLLERMRSRADTTSAMMAMEVETQGEPHPDSSQSKKLSSPMAVLDEMEERMLRDTVLAKKRVRVVQLLIVGLVSLLFGWLGNFFVTSSCHFASSSVSVGQYSDPFYLHYGLWKYSPVDSALSGSYSCYPYYSSQHRAPVVARVANLLALLLGTYSQVCVWTYLIVGRWHPKLWQAAVHTSIVAGVLQLLTLCFFVERVCWSSHCRMGPASVVAVITAVVWFVFAWEVHYNTPRGTESIVSLEMRDLRRASAEYMTRFQPEKAAGYYRPPEIM